HRPGPAPVRRRCRRRGGRRRDRRDRRGGNGAVGDAQTGRVPRRLVRSRRIPGSRIPGAGAHPGRTDVIRILIADDQALVWAGFSALLDAQPDMMVVADVADGQEALRVARRERPDVVLMDIRMPGMDGLEATQRITADESLADTKVVILTTFDLNEYVFE